MKTNTSKIGAALVAVAISVCCIEARAQTATTSVTTTRGAFTEFVPGSETLVVRTDANPAPVRYVVTKQTTFVDETGAPVLVNQIQPGSPLSVQYTTAGDRLVASRIVVQHAPVVERTITTTTTARPLTHEEKERAKEQIEHRKEALEKAKDKLDDDDDDD